MKKENHFPHYKRLLGPVLKVFLRGRDLDNIAGLGSEAPGIQEGIWAEQKPQATEAKPSGLCCNPASAFLNHVNMQIWTGNSLQVYDKPTIWRVSECQGKGRILEMIYRQKNGR